MLAPRAGNPAATSVTASTVSVANVNRSSIEETKNRPYERGSSCQSGGSSSGFECSSHRGPPRGSRWYKTAPPRIRDNANLRLESSSQNGASSDSPGMSITPSGHAWRMASAIAAGRSVCGRRPFFMASSTYRRHTSLTVLHSAICLAGGRRARRTDATSCQGLSCPLLIPGTRSRVSPPTHGASGAPAGPHAELPSSRDHGEPALRSRSGRLERPCRTASCRSAR